MFRAGSVKYVVRIPRSPLVVNGEACNGLCVESTREILICPTVAIDRRLWVLIHELAHAHIYANGRPLGVESFCDAVATIAELAMRDLDTAGGEEALKRLDPGEELGLATGKVGITGNRYCELCRGTVAVGSVEVSRDPSRPGELKLRVPCAHCGVFTVWYEKATFGGLPSGVTTVPPRVERVALASVPGELRYVMDDGL